MIVLQEGSLSEDADEQPNRRVDEGSARAQDPTIKVTQRESKRGGGLVSCREDQEERDLVISKLKRRYALKAHTLVPSEEAEVWALTTQGDERLWLKRHKSAAKAEREVEIYTLLNQALEGNEWLVTPRLLARPSSRALLLSDLGGATPLLERSSPDGAWLTQHLPRALSELHHCELKRHDPLPLRRALAMRWRLSIDYAQLYQDQPSARSSALQLVPAERAEQLKRPLEELASVIDELNHGQGFLEAIGQRVLCHRDLSTLNLRRVNETRVGFLDFGQARMDWWGRDWVTLWFELSAVEGLFQRALERYLTQRGLFSSALTSAQSSQLLRTACLAHALSTLSWGARHADERVLNRGEAELSAVLTRWNQDIAW